MHKLQQTRETNDRGFTIIEVVLVLAIAGLIFLMVFIALPALQRSQADTQRRSDAGRVLSQISNYQTNNRGAVPAAVTGTAAGSFGDFLNTYMRVTGDTFTDPSGTDYGTTPLTILFTGSAPDTTPGDLLYETGATCNGSSVTTTGVTGNRKVAVAIRLTGGVYCTNN